MTSDCRIAVQIGQIVRIYGLLLLHDYANHGPNDGLIHDLCSLSF